MANTAPSSPSLPGAPSETSRPRPLPSREESVKTLERLAERLFPRPHSLDFVTVKDVRNRYPLTKLGAPALAAIEQSRRIVRARADYSQIGLAEFHIGLIYLDWDDSRAAAGQFATARPAWALASDGPAICLAHFAQGVALCYAQHREQAMLQFGHAERQLKRGSAGIQAERFGVLEEPLQEELKRFQAVLRQVLWPKDEADAALDSPGNTSITGEAASGASGDPGQAPPGPSGGPDGAGGPIVRPPSGAPVRDGQATPSFVPGEPVALPFSKLVNCPVPGHAIADERYGWYEIADKQVDFVPAARAGMWLLADREVDERPPASRELVIVGSRQAGLGGITVRPIAHSSVVPYCYLGYRVAGPDASVLSQLILDESEQPITALDAFVLAVVEGYWYALDSGAT